MTLNARLLQMEWLFYEKGMQSVFNELRLFANSLPGGNVTITGGRTFGALDLAATADVAGAPIAPRTNAPGWGSGQQQNPPPANIRPPTLDQP
jgi:hypothetical protein